MDILYFIVVGTGTVLVFMAVMAIFDFGKKKSVEIRDSIKLMNNPNNLDLFLQKGYSEIDKNNYSKAIKFLLRAYNAKPNDYDALYGLGYSHFKNCNYAEAKIYIRKLLYFYPELDNCGSAFILRYMNGYLYLLDGDKEQANIWKEQAISLSQQHNKNAAKIIEDLNLY